MRVPMGEVLMLDELSMRLNHTDRITRQVGTIQRKSSSPDPAPNPVQSKSWWKYLYREIEERW